MHTYRSLGGNGWAVGYWHPVNGLWNEVSRLDTELAAACRANILNGGNGEIYWKGFLSREPLPKDYERRF